MLGCKINFFPTNSSKFCKLLNICNQKHLKNLYFISRIRIFSRESIYLSKLIYFYLLKLSCSLLIFMFWESVSFLCLCFNILSEDLNLYGDLGVIIMNDELIWIYIGLIVFYYWTFRLIFRRKKLHSTNRSI